MSKAWIKYAVTAVIGLAIGYMVLLSRDLWSETDIKERVEIFCDALFVPGILLTCAGALVFCSSKGAFDGVSYLFHIFFVTHNWSKTHLNERQTYREYVDSKNASRKEKGTRIGFILIVGLVFMLASVVLLIVYSNM